MTSQAERARRETSPFFWLRGLVRNKTDLWKIADRLNVNPSTIQIILEDSPVSRSVTKKIETSFHEEVAPDENSMGGGHPESNHSTVGRLMEVYQFYREEKSLRRVGKKLGLSPERVRQLLKRGSEIGLFKYRPLRPPLLSRQKILKGYRRFLTRNQVARANRISTHYLSKLMALHHVTKSDLETIRQEEWRRQCMEQYRVIAVRLGHHPSIAWLQQLKSTRSLAFKIRRLWGSLGAFRSELSVTSGMSV
jgi:DNA-binding CsgD family transcriptional regulator